jgi:hypothetical protein
MKKFLLSLACVLGLGAWANATEVEFDLTNPAAYGYEEPTSGNGVSFVAPITVEGITLSVDNGTETLSAGQELRFYNGTTGIDFRTSAKGGAKAQKIILTSSAENIKSIVFTKGSNFNLTSDPEGLVETTWTGDAKSVTFTTTGAVNITKIAVTYGESSNEGGEQGGEQGGTDTPAFAMTSVIGSVVSGETYDIDGVVTGVCSRGFILTDNSGSILAYLGAATDYKVGDQIRAKAKISSYGTALQIDKTSTFEKLGEQTVTYPTPVAYDAAKIETAVARESDAIAEYVEFTGTVSVSGNYYNILVGSDKAQGSVYYATDDIKALLEDGKEVTIDGYFVSVSTSKYFNVVVTGVKVADEGGSDDNSTVTPETPAFDSIADFIAKAESGVAYIVNFPLTVGYAYNANIFVTDGKDFIQIYKSGLGLKQGDVIPAGWEATYTLYSSTTPELVPVDGIPAVKEGTFTAKEVELADVTNDLVNSVVIIKNVTFAEATPASKSNFEGTNGETTGSFRNNYSIESVEAGTYDVEAVITIYNNAPSIYVISYTKSTTTSVSDINVENGAVEYFNLQGVRVANPENGIYVRRQGNKVSKVVIR